MAEQSLQMKFNKDDVLALRPFFFIFLLFFYPLIFLHKSFILNDYSVQHLPWAWHYFQSLREGTFPYWTNLIACGFPLVAEGQAAPFYLLNILSYKLLPFMAAYTWSLPFHMALGGLGMYLYARALNISREGACVAAICFTFGSGFAGCFYNTGSLRALSWLPICLLVLKKIRTSSGKRRLVCAFTLAVIFSQQWMAGFAQMAVYSFFYCVVYETWASFPRFRTLLVLIAALIVGTVLAFPQILLTVQLIGQSVRQGESIHFALWGSVPPVGGISLLFPQWGNWLRFSFYIGIAPLFFVIALFCCGKIKEKAVCLHFFLAALFFLMALGKFNPLYKWAVETLSLSFMRNPSKFLFFTASSLSVLAGYGFDRVLQAGQSDKAVKLYSKTLIIFSGVTISLPVVGILLIKFSGPLWGKFNHWYVARLITEKGESGRSPDYYLGLMDVFFQSLPGLFSYRNFLNVNVIGLALVSFGLIFTFFKKKITRKAFIAAIFAVMVWDFYVFGSFMGTGFVGNAGNISTLETPKEVVAIKAVIKDPHEAVVEFVQDSANEYLPPNLNMRYGIAHPGGYSPLLLRRYYELVKDLGIVDSSLGRPPFSLKVWQRQRALLDILGAKFVHTDVPLNLRGLTSVREEDHFFIYKNETALPFITGFYQWHLIPEREKRLNFLKGNQFDAERMVVIEAPVYLKPGVSDLPYTSGQLLKDKSSQIEFTIEMKDDGIAFVRLAAYPGWRLLVDGKARNWFVVNHAFVGFILEKGNHTANLVYRHG